MTNAYIGICDNCRKKGRIEVGRHKCLACRAEELAQFKLDQKVRDGFARPPDYPDTSIAMYKEPMQRVEDGFGYYGAIVRTKDGEHIQCHICGYFFANLSNHIRKHKIAVREYNIKYGLRWKESLISPIERLKRQKLFNEKIRDKVKYDYKAMSAKGQKIIKARGIQIGKNQWSAQTRNEKGRCREQTIAKIKHVASLNNGIPTLNDYLREYGQGERSTVDYWFGTWQKACVAAGFTPYDKRIKEDKEARRQQIVANIKRFYDQMGRTPQWADFNNVTYFPNAKTIYNLFGSINNARELAGVPKLVYMGREWVEVPPDIEDRINELKEQS